MKIISIVALTFSIVGCAMGPTVTEEVINSRVIDVAAFDLNCAKDKIDIAKINDARYTKQI